MGLNITLSQFADFSLPITIKNPNMGTVVGTPINLTGCTAIGFVFKGYAASVRVPFSFVFNSDRATGKLTAGLTGTQTGTLAYGLYLYEIKLIDAAGLVIRILQGIATVQPGARNA